jgi:hypothetical protein
MEQNNGGPDIARLIDWQEKEELRKKINDLEEQISGNQKTVKEGKYSHGIQLLILDYLSIGKQLNTNVEKAKLYAPFIRRDLKTTEQYLTRLNDFKNEKNLELIIDFFSKAGFPALVQEAKDDLDRLKKRNH